jgi:hypothetical protein
MEVNRAHCGPLRRNVVAHFPERVLGGHNDPGTAPVIEAQPDSLNIVAFGESLQNSRICADKAINRLISISDGE